MSHGTFDESYYSGAKGTNYKEYETIERRASYKGRANNISKIVGDTELSILDYGCATGILLEELVKLGYDLVEGFDISDYAVEKTTEKGLKATNNISEVSDNIDVLASFDVFEHMDDDDIKHVLNQVKPAILIVKIPTATVCETINSTNRKVINSFKYQTVLDTLCLESFIPIFTLPVSRKDTSHINLKTKDEWIRFLGVEGYIYDGEINMSDLYNKKGGGVFTAQFILEDRLDYKDLKIQPSIKEI